MPETPAPAPPADGSASATDPAPGAHTAAVADVAAEAAARKRPRPGERRLQILQTLATMLEEPGAERITTAALAARIGVSEAALYRHFSGKAQMFEALIDFIEASVFGLLREVAEREPAPGAQAGRIVRVLLQFGERNPGLTRVMVGDALVYEHERLTARMNQFFDRLESTLRQCLRAHAEAMGSTTPTVDAQGRASVLLAFALGRLQRHARSGFRRPPGEHLDVALRLLLA
ncbi:nucleoid occlusion factor SlmA [Aquabacterium sp. J223]|uniref:nucleoid occlusion factor SlmA n=1 Tax=Aquabacterium sp. J223 TaxID=2898431 RepID=UPI00391715BE